MTKFLRRFFKGWICLGLLPPFFLDCVVALGVATPVGTVKWVASGFLLGESAEDPSQYQVFLVTNQHVIAGIRDEIVKSTDTKLVVRFNPAPGGKAREEPVQLDGWIEDANNDIAFKEIDPARLRQRGIANLQFFPGDKAAAGRQAMREDGFSEGDGVFVLGFPLGLVEATKRNFVIVRAGTLARVRDYLSEGAGEILIDAFVFPGNSGGPVVTDPRALSREGTGARSASYVIGMVKGYVPYYDIAFSFQTKQPRVIFEENSGLTEVIPIDEIEKEIKERMLKTSPEPGEK